MRRRRAGHGHARRAAELSLLALALALASSVVWGAADFSGGSLTRRLPPFAVTIVSQGAGLVALLVAVAIRGEVGGRSFLLGVLAGFGGGAGLAAFYRALSLGTMSVVSPIAACGAVVPFGISIALIVWRDTPSAVPRVPCDRPLAALRSRTSFCIHVKVA